MRVVIFSVIAAALIVSTSNAQTPMPIVVPAMTPTTAQSPAAAAVATAATREAVEERLRDPLLTPVAVAALSLWGRKAFGQEWFSRRPNMPGARAG